MTRIVWLCADPGIAYGGTKGASIHLQRLSHAVAARGAQVLLLVARVAGDELKLAPGVDLEVLPGARDRTDLATRLADEPSLARWIGDRARRFGADVLYERFALHTVAGSRAAVDAGIPHVVELNAPLVDEARRYRNLEQPELAAELEGWVLSTADHVLPVSRPLAAHAARRGARRTTVVPNAADPSVFAPAHSRASEAVFTGTLRPWHGTEVIAAAWERMADAAPRLRVVGDGPGRGRLEGVGAFITGAVPPQDVAPMLGRATIGLATYAADAPRYFSPVKLFEYLASGLAVVAADLPGVTDVVDRDTVEIVPAGDPDAVAEAVLRLVHDPARRERLGARARWLAATSHTWDHRAEAVLDVCGTAARTTVGRP